jgi:uncharacterized protein (DUF2141 family)
VIQIAGAGQIMVLGMSRWSCGAIPRWISWKKRGEKMKKLLLAVLFLLAASAAMSANAQSEEVGTLTININGFPNNKGVARVGLFNTEAGFAGKGKAFREAKIKIENKKAICEFKDIPKGEYAVRLFHDKNMSGKLVKNFMGVPKEAYGVSNNVKSKTGPPKYEKAKFEFTKSKTIDIKMN